jgi:hypothetical protein
MLRAVRYLFLIVVAGVVLAGCGSGGPGGSGGSDGEAAAKKDSSGETAINITFKGGTVTPSGKKIDVKAGEPIKLHIVADKPGELHVHSSPEQEIEYPSGTTDKTITIDQPGVVEMESHTLDVLVAQLEVR